MELNHYQKLARRTAKPGLTDTQRLTEAVLGLNGESGELADLLKKYTFHDHSFDRDAFILEAGDVLWYLAQAADALGASLDEIALRNIDKLVGRYPDGFDPERSKHRVRLDQTPYQ